MKLPIKAEKDLLSRDFIYKHRGYWRKRGKLFQYIEPEKVSNKFRFYVNIWYPLSEEDGLAIAPSVLDGVHANGYISGDFTRDDIGSYLDFKDTSRMIEFLNTYIENHLEQLMDAELMIRVYQYLRGKAMYDKGIVEMFPVLSKCIPREAPIYINGISAYLNILSRFDEAKEYLSLIKYKDESKNKLITDAENRKIQYFDILNDKKSSQESSFKGMEMSKNIFMVYIKKTSDVLSYDFLTKKLKLKKAEIKDWLVFAGEISQVIGYEKNITEKLSSLSKNTNLFMWLNQDVTGALWFEYHDNEKLKRKWVEIEGDVIENIGTPLSKEPKNMFSSDGCGERDKWSIINLAEKITGIKWRTLVGS